MKIEIQQQNLEKVKSDVLFLGFTEEQYKKLNSKFKSLFNKLGKDFEGKKDQTSILYDVGFTTNRIVLLGLGEEKELNNEQIRKTYSIVTKYVAKNKLKNAAVAIPNGDLEFFKSVSESVCLSNYKFDRYLDKEKKLHKIESINLVFEKINDKSKLNNTLKEIINTCENTKYVRDLVNETTDVASPEGLEKEARKLSTKHKGKVKITVFQKPQLQKMGCGLLLAVGAGSKYPPRLIILEYKGNPKSKEKIALVGKGITFDTGGYNIKPTGYMETMREDMAGAATVLATFKNAVELGLKVNLFCVMPTCENSVDTEAYKPGDIFKGYSGKTVQIGNTDAEGRLILADALAYTQDKLKPTKVLDLATLTGAMVVSLGNEATGIFSNNDKMCKELYDSGEETFERVWRLPIYDEFREMMKGDISDLKNTSGKRGGGSITAACFLHEFLDKKTPWVHLDIAGTSWYDEPRGYVPKYATGIGVRLLTSWLKKQ